MNLALQLHTIRDGISDKETLCTALENVAAMGYKGVEFAGFYGYDVHELRAKLAALKLTAISCHVGITDLTEPLYDYAKALGCEAVVLAWADTSTADKTAALCKKLQEERPKVESRDLKLLYHNHDHEFIPQNNVMPMDKIKEVCTLEVDTYWVFRAGYNAAEFLAANRDLIGLIHLKDGKRSASEPCAIGEGENDITAIVNAAAAIGAEWMIVENDNPVPTGLEDIKRSLEYLTSNRLL